ncbi:hypothetical protein AVEN_102289-1 [Araneus ventricosus]|uniref:Uncharacterized protein n=1 Tax=Araneus ventricosus TaxID=182803 RepID=A0A4Y2IGW3_ARAVE|nr:hypothetical protein AVEN_102289-1 [Araneus ventricosus]
MNVDRRFIKLQPGACSNRNCLFRMIHQSGFLPQKKKNQKVIKFLDVFSDTASPPRLSSNSSKAKDSLHSIASLRKGMRLLSYNQELNKELENVHSFPRVFLRKLIF